MSDESERTARGIGRQLRWWAGEYRRRGLTAAVRVASPTVRAEVIKAIEDRDASRELYSGRIDPRFSECVLESYLVGPAALHVVAAAADLPVEEGHHWSERHVYRLADCQVDVTTGMVFHAGRVLTASGTGWRSARDGAFLSGAGGRAAAATSVWTGPIAPMGTAHNYYHFILETLPRLLHIRAVAPQAEPVFAAPMPAFATSVLAALGIDHRVVDEPVAIHADDAWLCDPVPTNWPYPADYDVLEAAVSAVLPVALEPGPDRIYVTRRRSDRAIHDEAQVERVLADRGFTIVAMEDLTFLEQVAVVRDARMVVAPHGAGLTNIVFCRPGTTVIELSTGFWWNPCYRYIASMRGLPYRLLRLPWSAEHHDGQASDAIALLDVALAETVG